MKRQCLALDLRDDPRLIAEYQRLHRRIPPAIVGLLNEQGVLEMPIHRLGTRLFKILDSEDAFDPAAFARAGAGDPAVQAWEARMWRFQSPTPWTPEGQKWLPLQRLFSLREQPG